MAPLNESIPDLIRGTIRDGLDLVRDEILLARTELREEVTRIKSGVIAMAAAAAVGAMALVTLFSAIAWGLAYAFEWPPWAGYALVAGPLIILTIVLAIMGRTLLSRDRVMPKSVDTLKENAEWIRARTQS
jgi:hypothetical protein